MNNKLKRRSLLLGAVAGITSLAGCSEPKDDTKREKPPDSRGGKSARWVDCEAGVVCWEVGPDYGVTCLPFDDTDLNKEEICDND